MGFNNINGLWFLVLMPVVILFYLYKNKNKSEKVPSLFIWNKLSEKRNMKKRAFNRLLKNLLLALQLLSIIGFSFFIAEPYIKIKSDEIVLIADCSISMLADNGSVTLLDRAKAEMNNFLNDIDDSCIISVIKMEKNAEILTNRSNKSEGLRAVNDLKAVYIDADLNKALELADKISGENTQIYVFSARTIQTNDSRIHNFIVGEISDNTAIVSAFGDFKNNYIKAQIKNYSDKDAERTVMLYGENELIDFKEITVPAESIGTINFDEVSDKYSYYKVQTKEAEQLKADDVRYLAGSGSDKNVKILIAGEENYYLNKAVSAAFDGDIYKIEDFNNLSSQEYNLYVFNENLPNVLPKTGNILIFNPQNNTDLFDLTGFAEANGLEFKNIKGFEYLNGLDFQLLKSRVINDKSSSLKPAALSGQNPVIYAGELNGQRIIVFAFDLYDSDFALKLDFPIMIKNILNDFTENSIVQNTDIHSGDSVKLNISGDGVVIMPDGGEVELKNDSQTFTNSYEIGVYKVINNEKEYYFAVNSDLENYEKNTNLPENIASNKIKINQSLKYLFGAIIFILILAEWLVYNNGN